MGKKEKKQGPMTEGEFQTYAIESGMNTLIYSNPKLRNYAIMMKNNIDYNKIDKFIEETEKLYQNASMPDDQKAKIIYNQIANYVASGRALKDTAIQTLFDKGQEGKLDKSFLEKIVGFFRPNQFEGTKYFEMATNAYGDMYDILSQDEVAQKEIPELVKAARIMKMYGFLDVALKGFKAHEMMDDKTYKMLSKALKEKAVTQSERGKKSLEDYITEKEEEKEEEQEKVQYQKAAAVIGFLGILLIIFNLSITGNAIGGDSTITKGIIGIFMIFFALLLLIRPLKRSFKK